MKHYIELPRTGRRNLRTIAFLLITALALGVGLTLALPAHGAALRETGGGQISGLVTVGDKGAGGITVELRQRTNGGADSLLATTTSAPDGGYSFTNQPSAASDAFYYIRFTSSKGTLASWYTFPIIYLTGSDFSVPGVEMGDVALVAPSPNAVIPATGTLEWRARRAGETYRLFIYAEGSNDKALVDSGSLGAGTTFSISDGSLPEGKYEAVVQVRDAVVGYGQSQVHFHFSIGKAVAPVPASSPDGQTKSQPANPPPVVPTAVTVPQPAQATQDTGNTSPEQGAVGNQASPTEAATQESSNPGKSGDTGSMSIGGKPQVQLHLTADKASVGAGKSLVYTIEVRNTGDAAASGLVLTDKLPAGVSVDLGAAHSTAGSVDVAGNTVTVQLGDLPPNGAAHVEIPVSVGASATNNLSNQASALYKEAAEAVQSNAYIAQVAEPASGPPASQPKQPVQQPVQQPVAGQPQQPVASQPKQPVAQPPAKQPAAPQQSAPKQPTTKPAQAPQAKQTPATSMPQTGGSFPLILAIGLLALALLARYLRGVRVRKF